MSSNNISGGLSACPSCAGGFTATGACQPLIISCGDTFCRRCVQDLTDSNGVLVCPCCGEINDEEVEYSVNRLALSLITNNTSSVAGVNKAKYSCENRSRHSSDSPSFISSVEIPANNSLKIPIQSSSSTGEVSVPPKLSPSNHDECSGCKKDFESATDELEHCPHCGQAVCPVCKGEHKMLVLERLHTSRARIQEKMDDMRFSQQYKKETIAQLRLQGDAEMQKVKAAMEKAKMMMIEEMDKRKENLIKEVSTYVENTVKTLEGQLHQCATASADVESRLAKVSPLGGQIEDCDNQSNSDDLLQLCQTQITYGKCLKILENCVKDQPEVKATMLKFSDNADSVNLLNTVLNYGALKGSAALETNLKASEGYLTRSLNDQGMSSKRLHRYRAIVGGTPVYSASFKLTSDSGDGNHTGKSGKGCDYLCVLKDDRVVVSYMEESVIFVYDKNLESKETVKVEQCTSLKGITSTNSKLVLLLRNTLELYSLDNLRVSGKFLGSSDLVNPISLTASNNKIFVYDQDRDRCFHYIAIFDSSGKYSSKKFIAEARCDLSATISASKPKLNEDVILLTGSSKSVYLKVFNVNCEQLWEFNLDEPKIQGRKWRPQDTTIDNEGNFLVLDGSGRKVLVFNKDGKYCSQFDLFSIRSGQCSRVAVNSEGHVILMESSKGRISMY